MYQVEKNICVVMTEPKLFEIEEREIPSPDPSEVLVRVEYVGICGSDVHLFQSGRQGENVASEPMILGHEAAGVVVEVGSDVSRLHIGDRVAIEPGEVCGSCYYCKRGKYNLCPHMVFPSTPPHDGAYRTYMTVPHYGAIPLPQNVTTRQGAMTEPLSVALQNTKRGGVTAGNSVIVLGAGPIGLMNVLFCRMRGATEIVVAGRHRRKLKTARTCGATTVVDAEQGDIIPTILEVTGGDGADVVIDCTGTSKGLQITPELVRPGGSIVMVGMPPDDVVGLNVTKLIWKEVSVFASFRYDNCFPAAIQALSTGRIVVDPLITHEFPLTELSAAFHYVVEHRDEVIKAVIRI